MEDPARFHKSREADSALGLVPRHDQSGEQDPQVHITKTGDVLLRWLLVGAAHYILGPFGSDCDLRRWGLKLAERGCKDANRVACRAKVSRCDGGPEAGHLAASPVEDG
jgi:transposase